VKYEEVYLKAYYDARDARINLGNYFQFYKNQRSHQALEYQTPAEVFGIPVVTINGGVVESLALVSLLRQGPLLISFLSCPKYGVHFISCYLVNFNM